MENSDMSDNVLDETGLARVDETVAVAAIDAYQAAIVLGASTPVDDAVQAAIDVAKTQGRDNLDLIEIVIREAFIKLKAKNLNMDGVRAILTRHTVKDAGSPHNSELSQLQQDSNTGTNITDNHTDTLGAQAVTSDSPDSEAQTYRVITPDQIKLPAVETGSNPPQYVHRVEYPFEAPSHQWYSPEVVRELLALAKFEDAGADTERVGLKKVVLSTPEQVDMHSYQTQDTVNLRSKTEHMLDTLHDFFRRYASPEEDQDPLLTFEFVDQASIPPTSTTSSSNAAPTDGDEMVFVSHGSFVEGNLLANATDSNGDTLMVTHFTLDGGSTYHPADGNAILIDHVGALTVATDGTYRFTPAPESSGSLPPITYTVSDVHGSTDTSNLHITINNSDPFDGNESNSTNENVTLTVTNGAAGDLLNNATDLDGDSLSISQFSIDGGITQTVANSTASIAGVGDLTINTDGSYNFVPATNYNSTLGVVPTISYTVIDGNGGSVTSTLTLSVTPPDPLLDTVAPKLTGSAVNGSSMTLSFDEVIDAAHLAATTAFTVKANDNPIAVNSLAAAGSTVTLTLASTVQYGQIVTVSYADPTAGDDAAALQDAAGNDVAAVTDHAVSNTTPDPTLFLSIGDLNIDEAAGLAEFVVSLSGNPSTAVTVAYTTTDGTATTNGGDYVGASGTLTFTPGGAISQTVTIDLRNDLMKEPGERFYLELKDAVNAVIGDAKSVCYLEASDIAPTMVASVTNDVAVEGGTLTFIVTLSAPSATTTVLEYTLGETGSTAQANDYGSLVNASFTKGVTVNGNLLTVPAGVSYFTVTLTTAQDAAPESTESVILTVGGVSAKGAIVDNDSAASAGPIVAIDSTSTMPLHAGEKTTLLFALNQNSYMTPEGSAIVPAKQFMADDIIVAGGTLSNFRGRDNFFEADFTPDGSLVNATINIGANAFVSAADQSKGNLATTTLTLPIYAHMPQLALGQGVFNGATSAEAIQTSGIVTVNAASGEAITLTFANGATNVIKSLTGTGVAQGVVLNNDDIAALGDGNIFVTATPTVNPSGASSLALRLDTVAPHAASAPVISENADGMITRAEAQNGTPVVVSLMGTNAVAGDMLVINWGSEAIAATLTPTDIGGGTATVTIQPDILLNGGGNVNVQCVIVDTAGNTSAASPSVSVTVDMDGVAPTAITVHNASELQTAMLNAAGGETILLASGNYGALSLNGFSGAYHYTAPVTLKSADTSSTSSYATFSSLNLTNGTSNVTFDSVKIDYDLLASAISVDEKAINLDGVNKITIRNSIVDGDLVATGDAAAGTGAGKGSIGTGAGYGFLVQRSGDILLEDNLAYNLHYGFTILETSRITVRGNEVHHVRTDMMELAGVQDALVENNYLHDHQADWAVSWSVGDHRDMIQLWSTNTLQDTRNLTIRGNILDTGGGDVSQGIFMRNDEVDRNYRGDAWHYQNVLIEDNLIHINHFHGITVGATDGLTIRNNTILPDDGANHGNLSSSGYGDPGIRIDSVAAVNGHSTNVTIENNITTNISIDSSTEVTSNTNNLLIQSTLPTAANYIRDLFVDGIGGGTASIADMQALPGGLIEQMGVGADITRYNPNPSRLTALFASPTSVDHNPYKYNFDGAYSADASGTLDASEATFIWDFGDGSPTVSGIAVQHEYQQYGNYDATLTVSRNGMQDINHSIVQINDPQLLRPDFGAAGVTDLSSYGEIFTIAAGYETGPGVHDLAFHSTAAKAVLTLPRSNVPQLFDLDQLSIALDFKADSATPATGKLCELYSAWHLGRNTSGQIEFKLTDANNAVFTLTSTTAITDTNWHQVALTFDALTDQANLYLDGQLDKSLSMLGAAATKSIGTQNLGIGGTANTSFVGLIDEFELRSDILTTDQVLGRYNDMQLALSGSPDRILVGGAKTDILIGSTGNDTLTGASGSDILTGGTGADQFVFKSMSDFIDTITDFNTAEDKLVLSSLFPNYSPATLHNYVFASVDGNGNSTVYVDPNGSGDIHNATAVAMLEHVTTIPLDTVVI